MTTSPPTAITTGSTTPLFTREISKIDNTITSSAPVGVNYALPLPPIPSTPKPQNNENTGQQHWLLLEEMATNLVRIANQLRLMIDQAKKQSEANKDAAVTQAKIQAESEKAEAISLVRRGQLQQIIGTATAAAGTAAASISSTSGGDNTSQTTTPQIMVVSKVCQNCGREAFLECTGCYRSYYCGQFCQQKDWVSHKTKCNKATDDDVQQQTAPSITVTPASTSE